VSVRELVRWAAYGAAFAAEMRRGNHGGQTVAHTKAGDIVETVRGTHDARAAAKQWATTCADAAVASLEEA
jgi:hypothetical protein